MKRITSIALFLVFTVVTGVQAQWVEEAKLTALDGALSDYFGYSVCIDGDYAIVGAYGDDSAGSAYIFERNGGSWSQIAKLNSSDGYSGDNFGNSVCISGDYVIVGAPYEDPTYTSAGSAYIFEKPVGGWVDMTETKKLIASDRYTYDYFGHSVSISGNYAIVGAYGDDSAGSAYIFERNGGSWSQIAKLNSSDGYSGDNFGWSVSISGDYAIIGAPYDDDNGSNSGSAYLYKRTGTGWVFQGKLRAWDGAANDNFGRSVSISGDHCLIGAYRDDDNETDSGSAYIFERYGEFWNQAAKLTASDAATSDNFGYSVSINGNNVVVGAYLVDANGIDSGAVYRFERPVGGWVSATETQKLFPSDGAASDYFGYSVSVSGGHCLGGAYRDESFTGSAYVFGIPGPLVIVPTEDYHASGPEGGPFEPNSKSYTLTNVGPNSLEWTAQVTCDWLDIDPCSGTLSPGDSNSVLVSINAYANDLEPNTYNCDIIFTDITNDYNQIRDVILDINEVPGEIEVTDSIGDTCDLNMPFGNVIVGLTRTEQVTITNIDPCDRHELIVDKILLGYLEDFNDGQAQNWQEHINGQWDVVSGEYHASSPTTTYTMMQSLYSGNKWQDCSAQVTMRSTGYTSSSTYAGLILRASDDFSFPDGTGSAYLVYVYGTGYFRVAKYVSGSYSSLWYAYSSYLNTGTNSNVVKVIIEGSTIEVYFNGNLAWSRTDSSVPDAGRIGLFAYRYSSYTTDYYFDDFEVQQSLGEFGLTLPPGGPPWKLDVNNPNLVVDVNFTPTDINDYTAMLVIKSDDIDEGIIEVQLSGTGILDYLQIVPDANSEFSGHVGGPFFPWNTSYELYNDGPNDIEWSAEPNVPWLDVNPTGGTLGPYESILVTVMPNDQAEDMNEGYYCGDVNFTNITTAFIQERGVCLDIYAESKIWTSPHFFDVTLAYGETETKTMTIGNSGSSPLSFALSSRQTSFTPPLTQETSGGSAIGFLAPTEIEYDFTVAADGTSYKAGELLVRFAPREDRSWPDIVEKNAILSSLGSASIEREYRIVPGLCLVKLPAGVTVEQALVSFNNTAGILYAEPNYKLKLLSTIPNDTYFDDLWGMHNTGQTGGAEDADIDAPEAWDISTDAGDIIVAVIDSGIDYDHEDLAANMWVNSGEIPDNGQDDDGNGYVDDIRGWDFYAEDNDPMDYHGHGTHVAGTIGAVGNNSKGVIGVCWNVKLMALQITHYDQETWSVWVSNAIQAIEYGVANDAKIMSNSWGGTTHIQSLEDVIEDAGEAGVLFVAAAGNDYGNNNDTYPRYPSSYDSENIIAVMSTDHYDNMSSFSNYGPTSVDLGAPGTSILSCEPGNQYQYLSGTSMATPCVAGACALIWSADPSLSYLEVKDIVLDTVDPLPALDGLCVTGGRLNLHNALQEVRIDGEEEPNAPWLELDPNAGIIPPGGVNDINVIFDANQPPGTYEGYTIISYDPCKPVINIAVRMTVEPSDYFTELFEADYFEPNDPNCNDMANRTLIFVPDGSSNYYSTCSSEATHFPVDPNGGTIVSFGDDDYEPVTIQYPDVNFYGTNYDTFFISSNGYITFVSPDISYMESLVDHFALPRISLLFDDLNPSAGGTISWKQLSDRIAVTFENVPEYSLSNSNSFQVELFFNGMIRITWLNIDSQDGLVGLSEGMELPADFVESDLSEYHFSCDLDGDCDVDFSDYAVFGSYWFEDCNPQNNWCEGADFEPDGVVDVMDLQKFALQWLAGK